MFLNDNNHIWFIQTSNLRFWPKENIRYALFCFPYLENSRNIEVSYQTQLDFIKLVVVELGLYSNNNNIQIISLLPHSNAKIGIGNPW